MVESGAVLVNTPARKVSWHPMQRSKRFLPPFVDADKAGVLEACSSVHECVVGTSVTDDRVGDDDGTELTSPLDDVDENESPPELEL